MVNADAFRSFIKGDMKTAEPAPAPDSDSNVGDPDAGQEDAGLSPGDQAIKAINANDGDAFEEAIRRIK